MVSIMKKIINMKILKLSPFYICRKPFKSLLGGTLLSRNSEDIIRLEKWIEMCRYMGEVVPSKITRDDMIYMLSLTSEMQKINYLHKLLIKEKNKIKIRDWNIENKKKKLEDNERRKKVNTSGHIKYGLWNNCMFLRVGRQHISKFVHQKVITAIMHGQPIILDFSFEDNMNVKEKGIVISDTHAIINRNYKNADPFNLVLCNVKTDSEALKQIKNNLTKDFPLQSFENNYMDLFPNDKLVYLTPNSPYTMKYVDPEAIYIIGAIAERGRNQSLTLAKAKKEGIKTQKLPLNSYGITGKTESLSTLLVLKIIQKFQETGCWRTAFREIPVEYMYKLHSR